MSVPVRRGDLIRQRRLARGLTQAALAQQVGCARVTIHKIETDQRQPSVALAKRLGHALHLTTAEQVALRTTPSTAPQPQTLPLSVSTRLPPLSQPLHGREIDQLTLGDQLVQPRVRLVTVVGPPGVGKTSLALQVATTVQAHYHRNVVWLSLAALRNPKLLLYEIAQAFAVQDVAYQSLWDSLHAVIGTRRVLLVLDTFEHLCAAAPLLTQFLADLPNLTLLVTSRTRLGMHAEQLFTLAPLRLPVVDHTIELAALRQEPAVILLVERAQAVQPQFVLTETNMTEVAAICRRLDGLPLAIELAAARLAFLTPAQLLAQLEQSMAVLTAERPVGPPRHQSLDAALSWSYHLLTADEQHLLHCLAVFAHGVALAALAAVWGGAEASADDEQLRLTGETLIRHSLVSLLITADGQVHYTLLDTVRTYVRTQLRPSGDAAELYRRHATYYIQFMQHAASLLGGLAAKYWVPRTLSAVPDLRVAWDWLLAHNVVGAAQLLLASRGAFLRSAYVTEGRQWLTRLLEHPDASALAPRLWADLHQMAGNLAYMQGDYALGQTHLEAALVRYEQIQHAGGIIHLTNHLGNLAMRRGDYAEAHHWYTQSLTGARAQGNQRTIARALYGLAGVAEARIQWDAAHTLHTQALALRQQPEDRWGLAVSLLGVGNVLRQRGQYVQAQDLCARSLLLWEALQDLRGRAGALHALGQLALDQGQLAQAHAYVAESTRIWQQLGMALELAWSLEAFARLAVQQQQPTHARELFAMATDVRYWLQSPRTPAEYRQLTNVIQAVGASDQRPTTGARTMGAVHQLLDELVALREVEERSG